MKTLIVLLISCFDCYVVVPIAVIIVSVLDQADGKQNITVPVSIKVVICGNAGLLFVQQ